MNRITANLLTDLFNRSSDIRRINPKEVYIQYDTETGAEMTLRPFTPEAAAEYLTYFVNDNKHSLFDPMRLAGGLQSNTEFQAPLTLVFNGMFRDTALRKEYNVPLATYRYAPKTKESVLIFDRFYQEENPEMMQYIKAPSIYQMINALSAAGTCWNEVTFNAQNDQSRPSLKLVK
ncbi:MAG: hypothetical protein VYC19_04775 [Pseudomonadota bacterium]|jgi:hypothetical protein|nr:hypothetical protein [Alphaproteobacteria bacterium]MEC7702046.1 hypothetical protein [Pseudomonadota bacterium]MEC9236551.1 hypothetical protein [Pseudomonadota bacterium]